MTPLSRRHVLAGAGAALAAAMMPAVVTEPWPPRWLLFMIAETERLHPSIAADQRAALRREAQRFASHFGR